MARPFFELEPGQNAFMTSAVSILPGAQLAVLNAAYRAAVARKRLRLALAAAAFFAALVVAAIRRGSESAHAVHLFRKLHQLFRPHPDAGRRHQGVEQPGRMVLGLAQMAVDVGRDHSDQLCRHHDRGGAGLCPELLRRPKHLAGAMASFRHSPPAGIRPHRSRHRVRADLRHRLRARPDGGRAGDCDPFHGRAWKAVFRDRRKCRHEAGRRRALDRRELAVLHAVCRVAAGGGRLRQLCAAALRDQRSRSLGDGLCGRRRHRAGTRGRDPQVLLLRRQRDPADHHRHRLHHRYRAPAGCAAVCSAGMRGHEPVAEAGPGAVAGEIS